MFLSRSSVVTTDMRSSSSVDVFALVDLRIEFLFASIPFLSEYF